MSDDLAVSVDGQGDVEIEPGLPAVDVVNVFKSGDEPVKGLTKQERDKKGPALCGRSHAQAQFAVKGRGVRGEWISSSLEYRIVRRKEGEVCDGRALTVDGERARRLFVRPEELEAYGEIGQLAQMKAIEDLFEFRNVDLLAHVRVVADAGTDREGAAVFSDGAVLARNAPDGLARIHEARPVAREQRFESFHRFPGKPHSCVEVVARAGRYQPEDGLCRQIESAQDIVERAVSADGHDRIVRTAALLGGARHLGHISGLPRTVDLILGAKSVEPRLQLLPYLFAFA